MDEPRSVNLSAVAEAIRHAPRPISVLWQEPDALAFVARGRHYRNEFHVDPSDEVMYMIQGDMDLHYINGKHEYKRTVIREGEILHCPAGTPHSPRFAPDSFVLVLERTRRPDEQDRFLWFCEHCRAKLYETARRVSDYQEDVVSQAYAEFYSDDAHRTCAQCGHVAAKLWT